MAAPEAQNVNDGSAPVLAGDTVPAGCPVLTEHDWVTYVMALGVALVVVGGSLLLRSLIAAEHWPDAIRSVRRRFLFYHP